MLSLFPLRGEKAETDDQQDTRVAGSKDCSVAPPCGVHVQRIALIGCEAKDADVCYVFSHLIILLQYPSLQDLDLLLRPIFLVRLDQTHALDDAQTTLDTAKDCVLAI